MAKPKESVAPLRDEMTLKQVIVTANKKYGPGTIVMGTQKPKDPPRIPTGIFAVDFSIGGGLPLWQSMCGWGPESGAKTLVGIKAMRVASLLCWRCFQPRSYCKCSQKALQMRSLYIAAEGLLDRDWVQACGVDPESYAEAVCDYGEQYIDVAEEALKADDCGLLIFDSLAALTPERMLDSSASDQFMGTQAAMIGRAVRKLKTRMLIEMKREKPCTIYFINQMRKKLGCFDYNSRVWLADGSRMKIGKIVNQRLPVTVLSMDENKKLVPRQVVGWVDNGKGDEWLEIKIAGGNSGRRILRVTNGHTILTPAGEVKAGDLCVGNLVTTEGIQYFTEDQHEVILGSILGDGSLRFEKGSTRGHLRIAHGYEQKEYAQYKASVFNGSVKDQKNVVEFSTVRSLEFSKYARIAKRKGVLHVPQEFVDAITLRTLAIWYMDDGNFSGSYKKYGYGKATIAATLLDADSLSRIAKRMSKLGVGTPTTRLGKGFLWSGIGTHFLFQNIAPFVHPSMQYKIHPDLRDRVGKQLEVSKQTAYRRVFSEPIVEIRSIFRRTHKYDLTVEGDHNYLVSGVVVHNTMFGDPETQSGGHAMMHEFSILLRLVKKSLSKGKEGKKGADEQYIDHERTKEKASRHSFSIRKEKVMTLSGVGEFVIVKEDMPELFLKKGMVDDFTTLMNYAREYEVVVPDVKGWKYLQYMAKTHDDIKKVWRENPSEYIRCEQIIIQKAKERIAGGLDTSKK